MVYNHDAVCSSSFVPFLMCTASAPNNVVNVLVDFEAVAPTMDLRVKLGVLLSR